MRPTHTGCLRGGSPFSQIMKRIIKLLSALSAISTVAAAVLLPASAIKTDKLSGETSRTEKEIYKGVTNTHIVLSADSKYKQQDINIVEFDPSQADLYFNVVPGGSYANSLKSVSKQITAFNERADRRVICAINGDLWMTVAHSRNGGYTYKDCSDQVTTKTYTVPRGFNMYDGEIWTSAQMTQETPMEGDFYAFGITEDGVPLFGKPKVKLSIRDVTANKTVAADGLNRLPANNALVVYSDKAGADNYALSDAYEITVDCDPYVVCHDAVIKGKITSIVPSGSEKRAAFKENRLVFTARGSKIKTVEFMQVGDEIELSVSVTDDLGNTGLWQKMKNAVGGHIPVIINGKSQNSTNSTAYPMSVLGITEEGKVVIFENDGRQSGYSVGLKIADLDDVCKDLGIITAFLLDGGGSTALSELQDNGSYKIVNRPSDGSERAVVNTVILSAGPDKNSQKEWYGKTEFVFDSESSLSAISDEFRCSARIEDGALRVENTEERNQHIFLNAEGFSADEYKYAVIRYKPDWTREERYSMCIRLCAGGIFAPSDNLARIIYYDEGEKDKDGFVTQILDLSKSSKWNGAVRGLEITFNDYLSRGNIGEGTIIKFVKFCKTEDEAKALTVIETDPPETTLPDTPDTKAEPEKTGCKGTVCGIPAIITVLLPVFVKKRKE